MHTLILSLFFFILSLLFYKIKKTNFSLFFLFISSLLIGIYVSNLDNFLNVWDEQYHAIVAKNLLKHPFKPTLIETPLFGYDYKVWTANHIWLHKQPLFLWIISLSIKILGCTEFAVRFPSILLHSLLTIVIYKIGKNLINQNVGYLSAIFFTFSYFPLELVSGHFSTDHNDLFFLFFETCSFWAWFEYQKSKHWKWLLIIGVFSGCSMLVKWLMGSLVYIIWFLVILFKKKEFKLKLIHTSKLLLSSTIALIIFLPWQIYCFLYFNKVYINEINLNSEHFTKDIENHSGNFLFHFNEGLKEIYGSGFLIPVFLIIGIIYLIYKIESVKNKLFIFLSIVIVYLFYSFAATKMIAFTIIVFPFLIIGYGNMINGVIHYFNKKVRIEKYRLIYKTTIIFLVVLLSLKLSKIQSNHSIDPISKNENRIIKTNEKINIIKLKHILKDENYLIFNCNHSIDMNIPIMFYTDYISFKKIPTINEINFLVKKNYKIAIIDSKELTEKIRKNKQIKLIDFN